jgi:hypothetical protein
MCTSIISSGSAPRWPMIAEAPATEFVFDVTSDRKLTYAVSVFLPEKSVRAWAKAHGRPLTEAEQYAAAKLRLFRAFDELEDVKAQGRRLVIDAAGCSRNRWLVWAWNDHCDPDHTPRDAWRFLLPALRAEYNAWKEMGFLGLENKLTKRLALTCIKLSGL